MRQRDFVWLRLLLMLLMFLPLAVLFLMPGTGMVLGTMWFWLALMFCLWMVWMVLGVPRDERAGAVPVILGPRALAADELPPVVRQVMDVRLATEHNGVLAFRGPLKESADQTNGKVERFNRTLVTEWAYAQTYPSDLARAATYADWLHHYNHHRRHTGLGGSTPAERVHNLTGKNN